MRVLGRRGPVLLNISLVLAGLPVIADTGGAAHDVGVLAARLHQYNRLTKTKRIGMTHPVGGNIFEDLGPLTGRPLLI